MTNKHMQFMEIQQKSLKLIDKRDKYLKLFENKPEYALLDELYKKLPTYYYSCGSAILNTPLALPEPVSPNTAAIIGTVVGGTAVGMAAALSAKEKETQYRQNEKAVIRSKFETKNAYKQLSKCCLCIEDILKTQEATRVDWENTLSLIRENIDKEQKKDIAKKQAEVMGPILFGIIFIFVAFIIVAFSIPEMRAIVIASIIAVLGIFIIGQIFKRLE
ncbi:MAG: hypothetical protein NC092_01200 [Butyrivibrio sp.]|nr:hypothetical protein [Muribaculum sp.]MCM1551289.1 hypothetical protein [Butyrivibrio sp.]